MSFKCLPHKREATALPRQAPQNGGVSDHRGQDSGEKETERHREKLQLPRTHGTHAQAQTERRAILGSGQGSSKQQALDGLRWR